MSAQGADGLRGDALAEVAEAALGREELAAAVALFDRAEPEVGDPDRCAGGRWMAHMLAGDFGAAWRESDAIRGRGAPDPHRFWNGEAIGGKRLMLRSLHGFGDAVQMFRFLPRLQALAAHVTVEVPPRLVELAPCFAGMGEVITWGEAASAVVPAWDVQMEVMELPYFLRVTTGELAPGTGYLRIPEAMAVRVAGVLGPRGASKVGLVWSAGHWNPSRSVPFALLRELLGMRGAEFWSLQGEGARGEWQQTGGAAAERDVDRCGEGILPLAAAIAQMDLVITVDTLAAHLAGALGVPCWVLLQRHADWRWMCGREDTPWYPSLRLLRQGVQGDWAGLLGEVRMRLEVWLGGNGFAVRAELS